MEITTVEELKAVQSLVSQLQGEFSNLGHPPSEARKMAATKVGATYDPPVTAEELESAIGKARANLFAEKRMTALREVWKDKREAKELAGADDERSATYTQLYRQWCEENKHVAEDSELAHFTGATRAAFSFCRSKLAKEGYAFSKNGHGWNVECPAVERTYTEKEVRAMMEDLLGKFGKNG